MFDRALSGQPRSNNSVEGWHRAFNATVAEAHPSPFALIDNFHAENRHSEATISKIETGRNVLNSKKKYDIVTQNMKTLAENYDPNNRLAYLRGVSYNIQDF